MTESIGYSLPTSSFTDNSRPVSLTLQGTDSAIGNVGMLVACTPNTPVQELRGRYQEDGVLWVCSPH
jgi:hypothetical protein